jgi:hypothetical protein
MHCEAPAQDVLLRVSGRSDPANWSAFMKDVRVLDGAWIVVSSEDIDGRRLLLLRARPDVTYKSVTDATFNAALRNFATSVTFDAPRCAESPRSS